MDWPQQPVVEKKVCCVAFSAQLSHLACALYVLDRYSVFANLRAIMQITVKLLCIHVLSESSREMTRKG